MGIHYEFDHVFFWKPSTGYPPRPLWSPNGMPLNLRSVILIITEKKNMFQNLKCFFYFVGNKSLQNKTISETYAIHMDT